MPLARFDQRERQSEGRKRPGRAADNAGRIGPLLNGEGPALSHEAHDHSVVRDDARLMPIEGRGSPHYEPPALVPSPSMLHWTWIASDVDLRRCSSSDVTAKL